MLENGNKISERKAKDAERHRKSYAENREREQKRSLEYRNKHLEQARERCRIYRQEHLEQIRERERIYQKEHPEVSRKAVKKYRKNHPEKIYAQSLANQHVSLAASCEICGKPAQNRHHSNYSQPFVVSHLCIGCHREIHKRKR